ncbi:hypothetical protein AYI69_g11231 [Smittium culicis]|uniref:Uncharacterized protein n=1 Tax=Smittium culicis TaxID=133412 RepID=A0A1R1X070_9FUNG|nr:hypothetical protein AYI69_g11231 [Smittium culicis]
MSIEEFKKFMKSLPHRTGKFHLPSIIKGVLVDISTAVTQASIDNLYVRMKLSGKPMQHVESGNKSLMV